VLVTSVIGLTFHPHGSVLMVITLQLLLLFPPFKAARPVRLPDKLPVGPGVSPPFPPVGADKSSKNGQCSYIYGS
jgi:hypothetical protein